MEPTHTKLTSQGQISVPAAVRKALHLTPGSVLLWSLDGDRVVVERATRHSTGEVHQALFPDGPGPVVGMPAKTLAELKQGLKQAIRQRRPRPDAGG
jgi:AbrB family looped-hinge helix DNA binding protein